MTDPGRTAGECILLFSGGRDSTIAAVRLAQRFSRLVLVTVTTPHLEGIEAVKTRLAELTRHLPRGSEWVHAVAQPPALVTLSPTNAESCLPCHQTYVSTAFWIACQHSILDIAVGYSGYQSSWLEQTPYAVSQLRSVLTEFNRTLILPVYDLQSKQDAESLLSQYGLASSSLEQKCQKQQFNDTDLSSERAQVEIDAWARNLRQVLALNTLASIDVRPGVLIEEINTNGLA